jgi:hypothetical protein
VDACEYGDEPSGSKNEGNFLTSWGTVSFAGRTVLQGVSQSVWHGGIPLTRNLPIKMPLTAQDHTNAERMQT